MSWERRKNGGLYYTRSRRVDGKIVREYIGCGKKGADAARRDSLARAELERLKALARRIEQEERERIESLEAPVRKLDEVCKMLMTVALERAGYG